MTQRLLNRRQYGEFKQMLEQALLEIRLPAGIVDTDHIVPNSIRPSNCKLDASWDFVGSISANGSSLGNDTNVEEPDEQTQNVFEEVVEVDGRALVGTANIYFLNALNRTVTLKLGQPSKNVGRKLFIKRVDSNKTGICRILAAESGDLDGTDGIELGTLESVILIASSTQWHIFSRI